MKQFAKLAKFAIFAKFGGGAQGHPGGTQEGRSLAKGRKEACGGSLEKEACLKGGRRPENGPWRGKPS